MVCTGNRYFTNSYESWLIDSVLSVFTGVKVLVMGNQFHSRDESGEELVWMGNELRDELVESGTQCPIDAIYASCSIFKSSILRRDRGEYTECTRLDEHGFRDE